jgi:hypothetical protein
MVIDLLGLDQLINVGPSAHQDRFRRRFSMMRSNMDLHATIIWFWQFARTILPSRVVAVVDSFINKIFEFGLYYSFAVN